MAIEREDPYGAFNFLVEIDGVPRAAFSRVDGLSREIAAIAYRAGSDPLTPRLLPGLVAPARVTLRRGVAGHLDLQKWFDQAANGDPNLRRDVAIHLLSEAREIVLTWRLRRAFPVKLRGPTLDAAANDVAIESLTLVAEAIEVA